jgi:non-haem Fe2+, alpha-ketoglutarate-dependent halogenase
MDAVARDRALFERQGVAGPYERFAAPEAIAELARFFEHMLENQVVHPLYDRYSVRDWHLVSDALLAVLTAPELVEMIQSLTGADSLILWRSKLFEKYPGEGPIDWHQEYGYFDGEEAGGHRPALFPLATDSPWTWTVWLPLTDVSPDDGVMEFVPGSHERRCPTRMVPLTQAGAFIDPRNRIQSREELIERARSNSLIVDVDTRGAFDGVAVEERSLEELFQVLYSWCDRTRAAVTEPFEIPSEGSMITPMAAGEYVVFTQRCMHRSRGSAPNSKLRLAISARYTLGTTWVYPQRLIGDTLDGSGLDVRHHRCVRVAGDSFHDANEYM